MRRSSPIHPRRRITPIKRMFAMVLLVGVAGCQTWSKSHVAAVKSFQQGDINQSRSQLQASIRKRGAETELLTLEQAVVNLAAGNALAAENELREVRHVLDHLRQKDASEQAQAFLTDERAISYAGRDYEQAMVMNLLLLSSLLSNGQDSTAYAMQCSQQINQQRETLLAAVHKSGGVETDIAQTPGIHQVGHTNDHDLRTRNENKSRVMGSPDLQTWAMASYLTAAVLSENIQNTRQTEQALEQGSVWNPEFAHRDSVVAAGKQGTQCKPGFGAIHVIAMIGHAPEWVAEVAEPTSTALLIADRVLSATGKHSLPPTVAPVRIGRPIADPQTPLPGFLKGLVLRADADNSTPGTASEPQQLTFLPLVDLNLTADASYEKNRDHEIARTITRRVVKKSAVYAAKEVQNIQRNSFVDLAFNVGGVVWEAMEKPDLRSWRLLPARIELAHAEIPAGDAVVSLKIAGQPEFIPIEVHVENGRNTYVTVFIPDRKITGRVLLAGPEYRSLDVPAK